MSEFQNVKLPENPEISVEEIQDLMQKVEEFIAERGNPSCNIIWLANLILKRLMQDRDYFANIEGIRGAGKSNFILLLALIQCRYAGVWRERKTGRLVKVLPRLKPLDPEEWEHVKFGFSFDNNMSFLDEAEAVRAKFYGLDRYMPFIIDEGSKNLHKYEWNSKLQFLLVRMSDTERYQNKSVYVCFPNFKELNSAFRNDRIMMRIYLYDRKKDFSSAIITLKDVNRYVTDPWHTDENAKQFEYHLRRRPAATRSAADILYAEKKLAGFAGNFDIPSLEKLAPRIWDIYMKYKIYHAQKDTESSLPDEEKDSKKVLKWKFVARRLIDYIKNTSPGTKVEAMAKLSGLSRSLYRELIDQTTDPSQRVDVVTVHGDAT
jgi:hypothetical protein